MKTLVLTDNAPACELAMELDQAHGDIDIFQSPSGPLQDIPRLVVREQVPRIVGDYGLVLSIHGKQIFPPDLVRGVRCVNVHPGLNPHNRGWFPQVYSIINGLPAGVTIHEIDEELDHGPIIAQCELLLDPWDTSGSAYAKIMKLERAMVLEHFSAIRAGTYEAVAPSDEGNLNLKKAFDELKHLDLDQSASYREVIDRLRALTHGDFQNAYFLDPTGRKVFVRIELEPEGL